MVKKQKKYKGGNNDFGVVPFEQKNYINPEATSPSDDAFLTMQKQSQEQNILNRQHGGDDTLTVPTFGKDSPASNLSQKLNQIGVNAAMDAKGDNDIHLHDNSLGDTSLDEQKGGKTSKRKSMKRKSMKRKSMKLKSMKRKSMKRKSMKRKSMKLKSMKRKSMKRKSMKRKSMKRSKKGGKVVWGCFS